LAPPDAIASRLASFLCRIAALPAPTAEGSTPALVFKLAEGQDYKHQPGTTYIAFGTQSGVEQAFLTETKTKLKISDNHRRVLKIRMFVQQFVRALRGELPPLTNSQVQYTLGGILEPGVLSLLIVPD
jgi:hypothetical protein